MPRANKPGEEGTAKWFQDSRSRCVDHLRALLSIKLARTNMADILSNWGSQTAATNGALHSACVISYARLFVHSETSTGKITYPSRHLMRAVGFDLELHKHILELRNQIIAHGDYHMFPSTMYLQSIGDNRLPIALGINVKGMLGISSRDLALRYEKHFSVCEAKIEELLKQECDELATQAKVHPATFMETHNVPEHSQKVSIDGKSEALPGPTGPAATVEAPEFPSDLMGYNYITLTHQAALIGNGEYVVTIDGIEKTLTFSID
jgi:hypothetical protein